MLESLKAIRKERVKLTGIELDQITIPDPDQQKILELLQVKL